MKIKNPLISRGLGRRLKKEVLGKMELATRRFEVHAKFLPDSIIEGKDSKGAAGIFVEGYASTSDLDRTGEIVEPVAFADSIKEFMENPVLCYMHDWSNPIGKIVDYEITEMGLWVRAFISSAAENVIKLVKDGILRAFSIGYDVVEEKTIDGVLHLLRVRLYEISVVSVPANRHCLFNLAKAVQRGSDLEPTLDEMRRILEENDELRAACKDLFDVGARRAVPEPDASDLFSPAAVAIAAAGEIAQEENEIAEALTPAIEEVAAAIKNDEI